ncbi:MAG: aspartate aminotransferase family protein, partial [Actinomycetota bacterium]
LGLWYAIDVAPEESTQPLVNMLAERGVIVGSVLNSGGTIRIAPPLVVEEAEIDVLIGALRSSLAEQKAGR